MERTRQAYKLLQEKISNKVHERIQDRVIQSSMSEMNLLKSEFMNTVELRYSKDPDDINNDYISRIASYLKLNAESIANYYKNQHLEKEDLNWLRDSLKESRVIAITYNALLLGLESINHKIEKRNAGVIEKEEDDHKENMPFKSVLVVSGSPFSLGESSESIIAWLMTERNDAIASFYVKDNKGAMLIMRDNIFKEAFQSIFDVMTIGSKVAPTPGQIKKWRMDHGKKALPPPSFYKVKIPEFVSERREPETTSLRKLNWRHDRRSHFRLLFRTGDGILEDKYVNGLTLRGYDVFQFNEKIPKEIMEEIVRKGKSIKEGFWIAIKQVKVKSSIVGPKDKKYIPAQRQ